MNGHGSIPEQFYLQNSESVNLKGVSNTPLKTHENRLLDCVFQFLFWKIYVASLKE